jgi:hypothetical protein
MGKVKRARGRSAATPRMELTTARRLRVMKSNSLRRAKRSGRHGFAGPTLSTPVRCVPGRFDASVDGTSAPNITTRTLVGVSDLRALRASAWARMSMWPKQVSGSAVRAEVGRTDARSRALIVANEEFV